MYHYMKATSNGRGFCFFETSVTHGRTYTKGYQQQIPQKKNKMKLQIHPKNIPAPFVLLSIEESSIILKTTRDYHSCISL